MTPEGPRSPLPLLNGRFEPITSEIGFLECEAKSAAKAHREWQASIHAKRGVTVEIREVHGDPATKLSALLPLTSVEIRRHLFVPTKSAWTAYVDNAWRGTDAFPPTSHLAQALGCRGVRAVWIPHTIRTQDGTSRGRYGATIFELYAPTPSAGQVLNTVRSICAANDGGRWKFSAVGSPQDFEEPGSYEANRVADRFTAAMLGHYLSRLGIELFSPDFFDVQAPAFLVSKHGLNAPGMEEFSLEHVQARF
jgi:hypothetical protein